MKKAKVLFTGCMLFLLAGISLPAVAQIVVPAETDTTQGPILEHDPQLRQQPPAEELNMQDVEEIDTTSLIIPAKAAFYSAVLPGLGQAYNNSHWKIPIIYIGAAFIVQQVNYNNYYYNYAVRNMRIIDNDSERAPIEGRDFSSYERIAERARRERDYMIIIGIGVYALNIVDAYVEAHLKDFDLNDDLAMRIRPSFMAGGVGQPGAGIALTLHLK
jgi:hypothetical protein